MTAPASSTAAAGLTDIGANLLDGMFSGEYHGRVKHAADIDAVLARAARYGLSRILVTAGTLEDSHHACQFIREHQPRTQGVQLFTTVGVHPTMSATPRLQSSDSDRQQYFDEMLALANNEPLVVAVGECGLDGDRTHFASMDAQRAIFPLHLTLAAQSGLPLFLHDRSVGSEVLETIESRQDELVGGGVVHSFTGSSDLARRWCKLSDRWFVSINGCSLKTDDNCIAAAEIPLDRLLVETDAPWCEIKPTHAAYSKLTTRWRSCKPEKYNEQRAKDADLLVKNRNEPCAIISVVEAMAAIKGVSVETVREAVIANTQRLFFDNPTVRRKSPGLG